MNENLIDETKTVSEVTTEELAPVTAITQSPPPPLVIMRVYPQVQSLLEYARSRDIKTDDDAKGATNDLVIIGQLAKQTEAMRRQYTNPLNEQVKIINDAFRPVSEALGEADRLTRSKIIGYRAEIERQRKEIEAIEAEKFALAQREAALKGGEITVDLTPIPMPEEVPKHVRGDIGMAGATKIRKYRVVDFALMPDLYKLENKAMLNAAAKSKVAEIPGVEFYFEDSLRVSTYNRGGNNG